MIIKIKKQSSCGTEKSRSDVSVREILISEDFAGPGSEIISVCYRGSSGVSGIIELTMDEAREISHIYQKTSGLVKGYKVLKGKSPI